jgi:hypothetical protein
LSCEIFLKVKVKESLSLLRHHAMGKYWGCSTQHKVKILCNICNVIGNILNVVYV